MESNFDPTSSRGLFYDSDEFEGDGGAYGYAGGAYYGN